MCTGENLVANMPVMWRRAYDMLRLHGMWTMDAVSAFVRANAHVQVLVHTCPYSNSCVWAEVRPRRGKARLKHGK